jgi:hypothetical protein
MNTDELRKLAVALTDPKWGRGHPLPSKDTADRFHAAASPSVVLSLLDRIEELDAEVQERILAYDITCKQAMANGEAATLAEAERDEAQSEALEQARLLGKGAERELKLMAERDEAREAVKRLAGALTDLIEREAHEDWMTARRLVRSPIVKRIVEE